MTQLKSQILGIALAITTAIGCIVYEKLVKNYSIGIIILLAALFYVPVLAGIFMFNREVITGDISRLLHDRTFIIYSIIYILTWATVPLWYIITRNQGILVGSIYEVKYIIIIALFYVFLGDRPVTLNVGIGIACALVSIYFISK